MEEQAPRFFVQTYYGRPWVGAEDGGEGRGDRHECKTLEEARALRKKLADPKYGNTSVRIEVK